MADPTEAPRARPVPQASAESPGAPTEESAHLDPPGAPGVEASGTPGAEAREAPPTPRAGDGWLDGPPPAADTVLGAEQEEPVSGDAAEDPAGPSDASPPTASPVQAEAPPAKEPEALQDLYGPESDEDDPPTSATVELGSPVGDDEVAEEVEEGAPAWMMTFGDMMSLLLTFFILLFSMSSIEVEKFKAATESLAEALGESNAGVMPDGVVPVAPPPTPVGEVRERIVEERMDDIAAQLEEFVRENRLEEQVVVSKESHGVFLRMQNQALFGPGSADIAAASVAIVEQLGSVLERMDLPVKVSGHTDNVPIRSSVFPSNWELSAARAAGVARILVSRGHDPSAVAVEAFGEHQPVASNDTAEGRAENRRVELYFSRLSVEAKMDERGELPEADGEDDSGEETAGGGAGAEAVGAEDAPAEGG